MSIAKQLQNRFTYADYLKWPEDERWELIDGVAYAMAAPGRLHQETVLELGAQILQQLRGTSCKPYIAPFDVRLAQANETDDRIETVVQPDLAVICDKRKLDDKGCRGAPDWIIEVLSPSTAVKDMDHKRRLYEHYGVKEYWIVHPVDHWVMVYTLQEQGHYDQYQLHSLDMPTTANLFPELSIDWDFLKQE